MNVPFVDLKSQYQSIKEEVREAIENVCENASFVQGPQVEKFEKSFAKYLGVKRVSCVGSGTSALYLALRALDIKEGDEVITVPNSFFATAEAITLTGAKPVFVDVDESTALVDVKKIPFAITKKTKAIIPVHLYGQCADMDEILKIAKENNLFVIEDACQAHGAEYKGRHAGTMGDLACFSFYPGKNLGTYGEGGAVAGNNEELVEKVKMFRNHGGSAKYVHDLIGGNFRMSGIEGAVLNVKLKYLDRWNDARRLSANVYAEFLRGLPIELPKKLTCNKHVFHLFVIRVKERDELLKFLSENGVGAGIHYPIPIHLQKAYQGIWKEGDFPIAEKLAKESLSLPMHPNLTVEQILYSVELIKNFYVKN